LLYVRCRSLDELHSVLEFTLDYVEGLRRVFCCNFCLGLCDAEGVADNAQVGRALHLQDKGQGAADDVADNFCRHGLASNAFNEVHGVAMTPQKWWTLPLSAG
jgi:hypothetical protein